MYTVVFHDAYDRRAVFALLALFTLVLLTNDSVIALTASLALRWLPNHVRCRCCALQLPNRSRCTL